jgi:hypothetical protein
MVKRSFKFKLTGISALALTLLVALLAVEFSAWPASGLLPAARATKLEPELTKAAEHQLGLLRIRLDGSVEASGDRLYLPLLPTVPATAKKKDAKPQIESTYPPGWHSPDVVFYSNGWAHIRLQRKGEACTLAVSVNIPDKVRKKLESLKFPSDLIVPQGFVVPKSYKALIQDVPSVNLVEDSTIYSA